MPDGLLSVLEIFDVQDSDFATYNCSASNADEAAYLPIKFSETGTSFNVHYTIHILRICFLSCFLF